MSPTIIDQINGHVKLDDLSPASLFQRITDLARMPERDATIRWAANSKPVPCKLLADALAAIKTYDVEPIWTEDLRPGDVYFDLPGMGMKSLRVYPEITTELGLENKVIALFEGESGAYPAGAVCLEIAGEPRKETYADVLDRCATRGQRS